MTEAWGLATSDHPDPVIAAVALVHEQINPLLLADGYTQDAADQVLARITHDLCAAPKRAAPHERGDVAKLFALRVIVAYRDGGHRTH
jgi:hypothetical protein